MQCIDRLNEACLPTGDVLLPAEEQRLPAVRCASYEWTNVFFHVEEVHWTFVRIVSPDGVPHVGRPNQARLRVGEDCRPRRGAASDLRTSRCQRWGAPRRTADRSRLPMGEEVLPPGRSASDAPTHHGPRWCAPRRTTRRARLPTARAVSSGRMHCDVRPEEAMPPSVVGVTTIQEPVP